MSSPDLSEFHDTFFDEAQELLQGMEQTLLSLDPESPDHESLNAIFRCAHSIKGGAAAFGVFDDLVSTTHKLENILDLVRNGKMPLTHEAISVFLKAKDVLWDLVQAYREQNEPGSESARELLAMLQQLSEAKPAEAKTATQSVSGQAVQPIKTAVAQEETPPEKPATTPDVVIPEGEKLLKVTLFDVSEKDRLSLHNEMGIMGTHIRQSSSGNEHYYWLSSALPPEDIIAVCCFVIDESQIKVEEDKPVAQLPSTEVPEQMAVTPEPVPTPVPATLSSSPVVEPTPGPTPAPASAPVLTAKTVSAAPVKQALPKTAAASKESGTIRVPIQKVDQLVNQVGEMVINQSILMQANQSLDPIAHASLIQDIEHMGSALRTLQEAIMALRMMPMDYAFGRFPRLVRETAGKLGKQIELITKGGGTELDKGLIERMIDPLTHLIRNSLDHGIEMPEKRIASDKDPVGKITISAQHQGGRIIIEVIDDGAGMDREKLINKAIEKGLPASHNMTDDQAFMLIFEAGFSTAEKVTDVSGRGVGMDVVKRNIQELGGLTQIESEKGKGTTIRISLPLTLAIMDGMTVQSGKERFVLPLSHIVECLQPSSDQIRILEENKALLLLRGEHLPIINLWEIFSIPNTERDLEKSIIAVLQVGKSRYALAVDQLLGQHQIVVKNLETHFKRVPGVSGATILGDGSVALILDAAAILEQNRLGLMPYGSGFNSPVLQQERV
ncbi:chemotaxis protein CheA [Advenella faeciporci]|uniref:Chemotaxis protein CheA n=1 Tax=Advenella faeciporci TaxID=797535 RepID=A0A918JNW3_9BURK|nr:chemotaxis protein CheW [Advenella faeciporci]GGW93696.1 chemotaxis protein CheA [Advenella faeciporci]